MANTENRRINIYFNNKEEGKTIKAMEAEYRKLNAELKTLAPNTQAYNNKLRELRGVGTQLDAHRDKVKGLNGVWSSISKEVKAFGLIALGALGFQAITGQISNLINKTAELSDAYANIQKTTGLTKYEVEALANELGKMDTRTSRMELLKLAAEAGKLGITGAGNIKKFVEEADKINVALGEDLGQDAILQIGKLSDVFGTGMLNIGSAINSLGAASAASEGYLVDFAARLGGVAKTAGISAPDILGYGAVLDSLGLQAEMSSTALSNFFIEFTKNAGKFESAAGMAKGSLSELIGKEGTNAGFIAFLENLKANSSGADDFLRRLEKLGIDGSRGAQVFLTLSNNIGKVKEQQAIANTEFEKGTSIINEFNVKNETFAAKLEKLQKMIARFFTDNFIVNGIKSLVTAIVDNADSMSKSFNNFFAPIQRYIEKVKELFNGIAILLQRTELGNSILNVAAKVWGYVGKAIAFVYDGLVFIINGFERAIATAAGIKASFETLIDFFKTTVKNAFAGIGEMLSGVFSLDANKIKQGIATLSNSFKTLGSSVANSFIAAYNDTMKVFKPIPNNNQVDFSVTGSNKKSSNVDFTGLGTEQNSNSLEGVSEKVNRIKQDLIEIQTILPNLEPEIAEPVMKAIIPLSNLSNAPFSSPSDAPKTPEEWDNLKEQANDTLASINTVGNGVLDIVNLVSARQQAELQEFLNIQEQKKEALQRLYESGEISAEDYNKKINDLDQQSARKKRELAVKEARRQKVANVFSSIINTASAVVEALPNIPLAAAIGFMGAVQTGLIAAQPVPEFAKGGLTTFANGGPVIAPRMGLIGEAGPEWVAPNWMLRNPATANIIGALESVRQNKRVNAFADGGSTAASITGSMAVNSNGELVSTIKALQQTNMMLMQRLQEPLRSVIGWNDTDTRELQEKQTRYTEILNDNTI